MDGRAILDSSPALIPNIQRLMKIGVQFVNTYSNAPECTPSRSSLRSGRRTDLIETWNNGKGLDIDYPIDANRLNTTGYDMWFIGRRDFNEFGDHFQPQDMNLSSASASSSLYLTSKVQTNIFKIS